MTEVHKSVKLLNSFCRFLAYNGVGIIKSHVSDAESSIDVEFHDIATNHALHFANTDQLSMAALSSTVLALASSGYYEINSNRK